MKCDPMRCHEAFVSSVRRLNSRSPNQQASEIYRLSKEIDGRQEASGTFPLIANRIIKLSLQDKGERTFYEPLGTYDELLTLTVVNARLMEGHAPAWAWNNLIVSLALFESAYGAPLGKLPIPDPDEAVQGIHQVTIDGGWAQGGDTLRFKNSWGEWGDKGYGLVSREYLERYMVEAWLARKITVGPSRFTQPLLRLNAADAKAYTDIWMMKSPVLRALNSQVVESNVRHRGKPYLIRMQETVSTSDDPVEMIDLFDPSGVPLGWTHLHHLVDVRPRMSVAKEFFVWPWARRQGYGRLLEDSTIVQAKKWGSEKVRILFHEADDYPGNVAAAKAFATGSGYVWQWTFRQRPNISAVADKGL